jgi:hypothetical protein
MLRKKYLTAGLLVALLSILASMVVFARQDDLAQVRKATARYHRTSVAETEGYQLVPGLDHCFTNPGVGAMGYHYINVDLLDLELDPLRPEAMVYAPGPEGQLQLAAVEYIVPAQAWEEAGSYDLPSVLGRNLHLNEALGVYVLHAWIFMNNPDGIFEDWNPNVTCP